MQHSYGQIFCKHMKHFIISQYFLSYGGSCLFIAISCLLEPPLWVNVVPSELACCLTPELVYLSRSIRVPSLFLVYRLSPVVMLFCKIYFYFIMFLSNFPRENIWEVPFFGILYYFQFFIWTKVIKTQKNVSCDVYSIRKRCCIVIPIADPTSIFVLNRSQ